MAAEQNLCITGGSDFHDQERAGEKTAQWLHSTHIPYEVVVKIKEQRGSEDFFAL